MKKLSELDKGRYVKAQSFIRGNNNLNKGVAILSELVSEYPNFGKLRAVFANALWEAGDREGATREFKIAVKKSPKSEIVSLGLFHCLLQQGQEDEAFEEMKRLTRLGVRCKDYIEIVREINEKSKKIYSGQSKV